MVFLVDHDRDRFVLADRHAARAFGGGVGLADQMALDQQMPIHLRGLIEIDIERLRRDVRIEDHIADLVFQRGAAARASTWTGNDAPRRSAPAECAKR